MQRVLEMKTTFANWTRAAGLRTCNFHCFFFFLKKHTQSQRKEKILIGEDNVQEVMIEFDLKLVPVSLWPWWCPDSEALAATLDCVLKSV